MKKNKSLIVAASGALVMSLIASPVFADTTVSSHDSTSLDTTQQESQFHLFVKGVDIAQQPNAMIHMMPNNRVYSSVDTFSKALGLTYAWDAQKSTLKLNGKTVPDNYGTVQLLGGVVTASVRSLAESVSQAVYWDGNSSTISIDHPVVELENSKGELIGSVNLTQDKDGVHAHVKVSGLTPGKHGFHVHENAIIGTDFKTAGGHFNPEHKHHGLNNPEGHHKGDLPNLEVKDDGTAETDILIPNTTLDSNKDSSLLGKSFIIHANEDDMKSDPAGNAGDRVAGGNIPQ